MQAPSDPLGPAQSRLAWIDGMRGLAIVLIVGNHYFCRWTPPRNAENYYPYGDVLARFLPFAQAELALKLLFVISGFVITSTLVQCRGIEEFLVRRFARIWPVLVTCSIVTSAVLLVIPESPWTPSWYWLVPSWTTVDPYLLADAFPGVPWDYVDGAYWTLWIEIRFYLLVALVQCLPQGMRSPWVWRGSLAILVGLALATTTRHDTLAFLLRKVFIAEYLPWFLFGIGFYRLHVSRQPWWREPLSWVAILGLVLHNRGQLVANLCVVAAFRAPMVAPRLASLLSWRPLAALGVASFSLYLLHQRIGVAVLNAAMHGGVSAELGVVLAFALIALMMAAALKMYAHVERPLNRWVADALLRRRPGRAHFEATM